MVAVLVVTSRSIDEVQTETEMGMKREGGWKESADGVERMRRTGNGAKYQGCSVETKPQTEKQAPEE